MTFDDFFQRVQQATDIRSQKELAQILGIGQPAITLAKKRGVPRSWSLQIGSIFKLNPSWLETGQGPISESRAPHAVYVPRISAKACAGGGSFDLQDHILEEIPFNRSWIQRKGDPESMVILQVIGESMSPEIEDGDHILVDTRQNHVQSQCVYLIGLEDTLQIKRVQSTKGIVILFSTNRAFSPVTLQGDEIETLRIIGRVLWSSRTY